MKKVFQTWKWALTVTVRSPLTVLVLAVFGGAWDFCADLWSALPKDSAWDWLLAVVWALALGLVAVAAIASWVTAAAEAATQRAARIPLRNLFRFSRRQFSRCLLVTAVAMLVSGLIGGASDWMDHYTAGSTFRALMHIDLPSVQDVWHTFEGYAALVFVGFVVSFLLSVVSEGWRAAWGRARKLLADCAVGAPFWTNLVVIVGILALVGVLANWVIWVQSAFWNDVQLVVRAGVEALLLTGGYFLVVLSLARFTLLPEEAPATARVFQVWRSSLGSVVRSALTVVVVAAVVAAWSLGAYRWLWLSVSSVWVLLLTLLWGLLQIGVAVAILTSVTVGVLEAASCGARELTAKSLLHFNRRQFARCLVLATVAGLLVLALAAAMSWISEYALDIASLLTFYSEKAVSPVTVGKVLWVIRAYLWFVVWGFLLSFLLLLVREGWQKAASRAAGLVLMCLGSGPFWTTLLATLLFGGLSLLVSTYVPIVPAGFWDYAQLVLRMGGALLLLVFGWLFWMLSLAKLSLPPSEDSTS